MGLLTYPWKDDGVVRIEFRAATFVADIDRFRDAYTKIARQGLVRNFATALNYRKQHLLDLDNKQVAENRISASIEWDF